MTTVLDKAIEAARQLPEDAQAELALEIMERVNAAGTSLLSTEQDAEIRRHLNAVPQYASDEQMQEFFAKHHVDL